MARTAGVAGARKNLRQISNGSRPTQSYPLFWGEQRGRRPGRPAAPSFFWSDVRHDVSFAGGFKWSTVGRPRRRVSRSRAAPLCSGPNLCVEARWPVLITMPHARHHLAQNASLVRYDHLRFEDAAHRKHLNRDQMAVLNPPPTIEQVRSGRIISNCSLCGETSVHGLLYLVPFVSAARSQIPAMRLANGLLSRL